MTEPTPAKRKVGITLPLIGMVTVVVGVVYVLLGRGADEQAANQALKELGGITVLGASQQHVVAADLQCLTHDNLSKLA